jgi:hypothetical protein
MPEREGALATQAVIEAGEPLSHGEWHKAIANSVEVARQSEGAPVSGSVEGHESMSEADPVARDKEKWWQPSTVPVPPDYLTFPPIPGTQKQLNPRVIAYFRSKSKKNRKRLISLARTGRITVRRVCRGGRVGQICTVYCRQGEDELYEYLKGSPRRQQ